MKITTTKKFDKQFRKQSAKTKKEFKKCTEFFLHDINDPILRTHKLSGKLKDLWSFNVSWSVRVIFDASHDGIVTFVSIGSHSELY